MFDPWTASLDEVREEERRVSAQSIAEPMTPMAQWAAAGEVGEWKAAVETGNGYAVMTCISICVTHGLVAPAWLSKAFNERYWPVADIRVDSWDDPQSFGRPFPKGKHVSRLRQDKYGQTAVWGAVLGAINKDPDRPIDSGLFEEVGKPLGFGATRAERLYRDALKAGFPNLANSKKMARLQKKTR